MTLRTLPPEVEGRLDLAVKHRRIAASFWAYPGMRRFDRLRKHRHLSKAQRIEARAAEMLAARLAPTETPR